MLYLFNIVILLKQTVLIAVCCCG